MNLPIAVAVDVTILIAVALAAAALLRRRAAALRHAILAASLGAAALVPALEIVVPQWEVPMAWGTATVQSSGLTLTSAPAETTEVVVPGQAAPAIPWLRLFAAAWAAGGLLILAGLLTGMVRLARATRGCTPIRSGAWRALADELSARHGFARPVTLLQSRDTAVLLTWGLFRPRIVLPAGADAWPRERREVVLAHELAHIRRRDWLLQILAEGLRAIYWLHPLVWIAVRRLREESEFACDEAVLDEGVDAADYAAHLLDVARHAIGPRAVWASAPAVANPSTLERRISAMLSRPHRSPLPRRASALAVLLVAVISVPVAALSITRAQDVRPPVISGSDVALIAPAAPASVPARVPTPTAAAAPRAAAAVAQQAPASLSGTILDQSGAVLPAVEVTLTDTQFGVVYRAVTDATGGFAFRELQPSRYEMVAKLAGFRVVSNVLSLTAGANVERRITLPLGSLQETITVGCSPGAAALDGLTQLTAFGVRTDGRSFTAREVIFAVGRGAAPIWIRENPPQPPALAAQDQPGDTRVRVGGQIKVPRQIKKVNPICPNALLPAGVSYVVVLNGRIGVDGLMNEVRLADPSKPGSGAPPPEFVQSAMDAVREWGYTTTLLNNQPVEVDVLITVHYTRM